MMTMIGVNGVKIKTQLLLLLMKMMMTVIKDHDFTDVTMLLMVGDDGSADGGGEWLTSIFSPVLTVMIKFGNLPLPDSHH